MSGIVGIVNLQGRPVDQRLLGLMTDAMASRGPDGHDVWHDGSVGFGHSLLRTTLDTDDERQPASLDGRVWITADARVDGRAELVRKLESLGQENLRAANDAQLILHAYDAWAEDCVQHLLGDFAFAIWDGRRRRLFCARDHFGAKPFYYAETAGCFVFSNTLECVRLHPGIGGRLNELAIGDFLLFGYNVDPATTTFAEVRRLAPAHSLTCGQGSLRLTRYWTLPTDGRIRYRRSQEYVEQFKAILGVAVADRLRTSHASVWISGGLDSTFIAATAQRLLVERDAPFELRGHTVVYDTLIPDNEREYTRLAGEALGVDISYFVADDYRPFEGWEQPDVCMPEPVDDPFLLMRTHLTRQSASHARVILGGEGGDEVLWGSYVVDLLSRMPLLELGADVARSLVCHYRRPGAGLRAKVKQWLGRGVEFPPYPVWLNSEFADRAGLRARWHQVNDPQLSKSHPLRTEAYQRLATAPWPWYFESLDPGVTGVPAEGRFPFLDVRLVGYLLAIPPLPWCINKQLLRVAMCGILPDPIRLRRKAGLAGDPLGAQLRRTGAESLDRFDPTPELAEYVNRTAVPQLAGACDGHEPWLNVRPLCLDYWLKRVHPR